MADFKIISSDICELTMGNSSVKWLHLGTIHHGVREYMCFLEVAGNDCYIEEITGGHLARIDDDQLANDLAKFCDERGITSMTRVANWIASQGGAAGGKKG